MNLCVISRPTRSLQAIKMSVYRADTLSSVVKVHYLYLLRAGLKYRWRTDDATVVSGPRTKSKGASTPMFIYIMEPEN